MQADKLLKRYLTKAAPAKKPQDGSKNVTAIKPRREVNGKDKPKVDKLSPHPRGDAKQIKPKDIKQAAGPGPKSAGKTVTLKHPSGTKVKLGKGGSVAITPKKGAKVKRKTAASVLASYMVTARGKGGGNARSKLLKIVMPALSGDTGKELASALESGALDRFRHVWARVSSNVANAVAEQVAKDGQTTKKGKAPPKKKVQRKVKKAVQKVRRAKPTSPAERNLRAGPAGL